MRPTSKSIVVVSLVISLTLHVLVILLVDFRPKHDSNSTDSTQSVSLILTAALTNTEVLERPSVDSHLQEAVIDPDSGIAELRNELDQASIHHTQAVSTSSVDVDQSHQIVTEPVIDSRDPVLEPSTLATPYFESTHLSVQDLINAVTATAQELESEHSITRNSGDTTESTEEDYYLRAWLRKVQRIGELNYPQEAIENNIYGKLTLYVSILSDGSLEEVKVTKTSGSEVLDDAAVNIVNLAAPFAAFPESMRKKTDQLEIVRDWEFRKESEPTD